MADALPLREDIFLQIIKDLGPGKILPFARLLHTETEKKARDMIEAGLREEWKRVHLYAHSMKTSVLSFGLEELSACAEEIENQCAYKGKANMALLRAYPSEVKKAFTTLQTRLIALDPGPHITPAETGVESR